MASASDLDENPRCDCLQRGFSFFARGGAVRLLIVGGQLLAALQEEGDDLALAEVFVEAVSLRDGGIVGAVCLQQLRKQGHIAIHVGKRCVGIFFAGIQYRLRRLLYLLRLLRRNRWPREIVVNYILRIAVVAFQPPAHDPYPRIVDRGGQYAEMI